MKDNEEFKNEPKEDKLNKFVNNMSNLETEEEAAETGPLNKFKDKIDNFDAMFQNKKDEFNKTFKEKEDRLNKLNNNVKKMKNYIE